MFFVILAWVWYTLIEVGGTLTCGVQWRTSTYSLSEVACIARFFAGLGGILDAAIYYTKSISLSRYSLVNHH
jgi:hypothetical protein